MTRRVVAAVAAFLTSVVLLVPPALAQGGVSESKSHILGRFMLGFGGETDVEGGGGFDLKSTIGFGGEYEYRLLEYVAVGGAVEFQWWKPDFPNADRSTWIDFEVAVKGTLPIQDLLELYVSFPLGMVISIPDDDSFVGDVDTAVGFTTGLMFGARRNFTDSLGAFYEFGWSHHQASHGISVQGGGTVDRKVKWNQFAMNFGVMFGL